MKRFLFLVAVLFFLVSCNNTDQPTAVPQATVPLTQATAEPTPTVAAVEPTTAAPPTEAAAPPPATAAPEVTAVPETPPPGQEAILIQEPGPGWRLTSPIRVSGTADSTFEQNLVVRLLLDDGTELALVPTTIAAELGQRGPFEVDIPFTISGERQAFLQVYATSARDGGITHLSSVGLTIADSGEENRPAFEQLDERIMITEPVLNAAVSGGAVYVEGVATASFEQTLIVELLDESGAVIGSEPIIVDAPDLGMPGVFQVVLPYTAGVTGAARVVVRDVSPAFGGDVHVSSVEIRLE